MHLRPRSAAAVAVLLGLLFPSAALACLWDYDTIKMERSRFPTTLELVTGKFLRHSHEFYQWRVEDRTRRLQSDPDNVALLDDLAVAHDKLGRHDLAVATADRVERARPGRYETASNLATFHFHAGRLPEALAHVERALRINPDAHFGREKYQKALTEYVLARRKAGREGLPLATVSTHDEDEAVASVPTNHHADATFGEFLRSKGPSPPLTPDERAAATKGVLGMMRFANHASPVLLEALGTILVQTYSEPSHDAKLLAARAFLKASYEVPDGPGRKEYRAMAAAALSMQTPRRDVQGQITLAQVEADFQKELAEARAWYAELRDREVAWVRDGKNPEAEFDALYAADPEVSGMDVQDPTLSANDRQGLFVLAVVIGIGTVLAAVFVSSAVILVRWWRRSP